MDLYPAIDIRDGGAVRLAQGDFDRQTRLRRPAGPGHPVRGRRRARGCTWSTSTPPGPDDPVNRATVLAIAAAVDVPVQSGGGVRTESDVEELLAGGVARVVLGTAALEDPGLAPRAAAAFPGRVAVGLDYRRTPDGRAEVAVRGWEEGSGRTVAELLDELAGAGLAAVVVTAIERDGMLAGPDLEGLAAVLARPASRSSPRAAWPPPPTSRRWPASLRVPSPARVPGPAPDGVSSGPSPARPWSTGG